MDQLSPGPIVIKENYLDEESCRPFGKIDDFSDDDDESEFKSFMVFIDSFSQNVKSKERVLSESISTLSTLTEDYFARLKNQTFINYLIDPHTPFFSDINTLLTEEPESLDSIVDAIQKLTSEQPDKKIVESLMENSIIENLFSIWVQLDEINLEILSIFTTILESFTEFIRPFFIENDIFPRLCPFLKEFNNPETSFENISIELVNIVCCVCKFSSAFFKDSNELPLMNAAPIIKDIVQVYMNRFKFQFEDKDLEIVKQMELTHYSLQTLHRFSFKNVSKSRLLLHFELYKPLFEDLNSDNGIFAAYRLLILKLISQMLNSNDELLPAVAEENLNIHIFHPLLEKDPSKSSEIILECINIFIGLVDIEPQKYASFLVFHRIINELFEVLDFLSYNEFLSFIKLYYKVLINIPRESAASNLINESALERMVGVSEIEQNTEFTNYLKHILSIMYEICYQMPSIIEIIDPAFDANGLLESVPKPFIL